MPLIAVCLSIGMLSTGLHAAPQLPDASPPQLDQYLGGLSEAERIAQTAAWLQALAARPDWQRQYADWVQGLTASALKQTTTDPDHPRRTLTVIDIARLARTTQSLWKIDAQALELHRRWQQGSLDWRTLADDTAPNTRRAAVKWLCELDVETLYQVAEQWRAQQLWQLFTDNQLLALLALRTADSSLFNIVWRRPADAHSASVLQQLSAQLPADKAIPLLIDASASDILQSQAVTLLVVEHSQHPDARGFLLKGLGNERIQWHVAANLSRADQTFRMAAYQQLMSATSTEKSALRGFALQQLTREREVY
ncbi:hypothetical protein LJ739_01620 [Aestuariibacter halophilus]|uniref:Uncharacterized protein n=2 Tax=Fluctibacter halophilus TaxID=226011 RepID=A0ABS8G2W9_9ALTE|nr:hypothetical protein [Aestuariibacter halophilus]